MSKFELKILEDRTQDSDKKNAAAIVPNSSSLPPQFAVIDTVELPDHVHRMVASLLNGDLNGTVNVTRAQLSAIMAMFGRTAYEAGVARGREISDLLDGDVAEDNS